MKKLIHLSMIAIIAITFSSCSKSANDLISNEKPVKNELVSPESGKGLASPSVPIAEGSVFYRFINQPYKLQLCSPDSYLFTGETAVFYVITSPEFSGESPSHAILTTMNYHTGDAIQKYQLISYEDVSSYNVTVPKELNDKQYMFAIVSLDDQYDGKTVTLHSEITINNRTTLAELDNAFAANSQ